MPTPAPSQSAKDKALAQRSALNVELAQAKGKKWRNLFGMSSKKKRKVSVLEQALFENQLVLDRLIEQERARKVALATSARITRDASQRQQAEADARKTTGAQGAGNTAKKTAHDAAGVGASAQEKTKNKKSKKKKKKKSKSREQDEGATPPVDRQSMPRNNSTRPVRADPPLWNPMAADTAAETTMPPRIIAARTSMERRKQRRAHRSQLKPRQPALEEADQQMPLSAKTQTTTVKQPFSASVENVELPLSAETRTTTVKKPFSPSVENVEFDDEIDIYVPPQASYLFDGMLRADYIRVLSETQHQTDQEARQDEIDRRSTSRELKTSRLRLVVAGSLRHEWMLDEKTGMRSLFRPAKPSPRSERLHNYARVGQKAEEVAEKLNFMLAREEWISATRLPKEIQLATLSGTRKLWMTAVKVEQEKLDANLAFIEDAGKTMAAPEAVRAVVGAARRPVRIEDCFRRWRLFYQRGKAVRLRNSVQGRRDAFIRHLVRLYQLLLRRHLRRAFERMYKCQLAPYDFHISRRAPLEEFEINEVGKRKKNPEQVILLANGGVVMNLSRRELACF